MAGDFTRLSYAYSEVLGDATDVAKATMLRNVYAEVIATISDIAPATQLRYTFIEVIADAPVANLQPLVMICT